MNLDKCKLGEAGKRTLKEVDTTTSVTDRLSHLPEPIIDHILSFLDTKWAVQTSVLSRAWRSAWKHVPVLSLRSDDFQEYWSFVMFVDDVLSRRHNLTVWEVRYQNHNDPEDGINSEEERCASMCPKVIEYALSHAARYLLIDLESPREWGCSCEFVELFGSDLICNLKSLVLKWVNLDNGFGSSGFGLLTTLHLTNCMLSSGPEDLVPFPRFPRLKNLTMEGCHHESAVKISGPQLVRLKLYNVSVYRIVIVAPKLKFLSVHGMMKFSDLSLPSLYHADISLGSTYSYEYSKELLIRHVLSLYRGLSNVISLLLDSYIIQVLSKNYELLEQQPSTFTRLESLIVEADSLPHAVVNCFFKGTSCPEPKLEFL